MAIKLTNREEGNSWLVFTDLTVGLFTLFVLTFVALAIVKNEGDNKYVDLENRYKNAVEERNSLLARQLKSTLEKGLIVIDDGKINIQASMLFDQGDARVKQSGIDILREIANGLTGVLDSSNQVIMVSGYTDDTPIKSDTYTNWELSTERATNVVKVIIGSGFPPEKIFAAGFGEFHPKVPNTSDENRATNRRVEIAVAPLKTTHFSLPDSLKLK